MALKTNNRSLKSILKRTGSQWSDDSTGVILINNPNIIILFYNNFYLRLFSLCHYVISLKIQLGSI